MWLQLQSRGWGLRGSRGSGSVSDLFLRSIAWVQVLLVWFVAVMS